MRRDEFVMGLILFGLLILSVLVTIRLALRVHAMDELARNLGINPGAIELTEEVMPTPEPVAV